MTNIYELPTNGERFSTVSILEKEQKKSKFEEFLQERWDASPLWYKLEDLKTRKLEGKFGFVIQLNEKRATQRRKPEDILFIRQPFHQSRFNFTKITNSEVLFKNSRGDAIITNVAPIENCHSLVVPLVDNCLPQILTEDGVKLTLDIMYASASPDLRAGFNSMGAFASVNHQHLHIYYLRERLFLETAFVSKIGPDVFALTEYPGKAVMFSVTNGNYESLTTLFKVIDLLLDNNICHNVYMTRGTIPGACYFVKPTTYEVIRIYLWARRDGFGRKLPEAFNVAVCELSGHLPMKNKSAYDAVSEDAIEREIKDYCDEPYEKMIELMKQNKLIDSNK